MFRLARLTHLLILCVSTCVPGLAITLRIENTVGSVTARVGAFDSLAFRRTSSARPTTENDTKILREKDLIVIQASPADGVPVDLVVDVPYGLSLQLRTTSGPITLEGWSRRTEIITKTGDLTVRMPWSAVRLQVRSQKEPVELNTPKGFKFRQVLMGGETGEEPLWSLFDKLPDLKVTYGRVVVQAEQPGRLILEDIPIPKDSPVKLPWQAQKALQEILEGREEVQRQISPPPAPQPEEESTRAITVDEGMPLFSSDVRLVNLTAAVVDKDGHPLLNLQPEDFEVIEDGVPQKVTYAGSDDVPFNLVLLLDLSGSTRQDRPAMKAAATAFVLIAREQDRVAAYALANDMFHVISPLTSNRKALTDRIEAIPNVAGGSPVYDMIVLAYAEEFQQRPNERNALIVISDGVDNQVYGTGTASTVSFRKLRKAAEGMNALIYPIFLDPFSVTPAPGWSRKAKRQMEALAEATGGRLFPAQSIRDLDPVYPLVAEELRSVYSVAYSPQNQNFDGAWRQVQVRVKRPGAKVRTRTGYFAR